MSLLRMNGHSGTYTCSKFLHPGILVKSEKNNKSVIGYINGVYANITNKNFMIIYDQLKFSKQSKKNEKKKSIEFIQANSCLVNASDFDFVRSIEIDHMHCEELGIMKKMANEYQDQDQDHHRILPQT